MEFRFPLEEYSDHDEEYSLCDLVIEQEVEETLLRDSNTGSLDHEEFGFDFHFDFDSTTENVFTADDIFRHGCLLPFVDQICRNESLHYASFGKSNSEYAVTCRKDSMDSQSSFWSTPNSSQRKIHSRENLRPNNSKSKRNHKPPASGVKMSAIWRILTLGLMKTPSMKLEGMHLRQGKSNNSSNGVKNLDLRRSVSCNYYKDPELEEKEVKKTPLLKGWKTLGKLLSFKSRKTWSNGGREWKITESMKESWTFMVSKISVFQLPVSGRSGFAFHRRESSLPKEFVWNVG